MLELLVAGDLVNSRMTTRFEHAPTVQRAKCSERREVPAARERGRHRVRAAALALRRSAA